MFNYNAVLVWQRNIWHSVGSISEIRGCLYAHDTHIQMPRLQTVQLMHQTMFQGTTKCVNQRQKYVLFTSVHH